MARLLRLEQVIEKTGMSRASVYRRLADKTFPRPRRCGPNSIRFVEDEVDEWISALPRDNGEVVV